MVTLEYHSSNAPFSSGLLRDTGQIWREYGTIIRATRTKSVSFSCFHVSVPYLDFIRL
jgi:hypothetical protein